MVTNGLRTLNKSYLCKLFHKIDNYTHFCIKNDNRTLRQGNKGKLCQCIITFILVFKYTKTFMDKICKIWNRKKYWINVLEYNLFNYDNILIFTQKLLKYTVFTSLMWYYDLQSMCIPLHMFLNGQNWPKLWTWISQQLKVIEINFNIPQNAHHLYFFMVEWQPHIAKGVYALFGIWWLNERRVH